MAPALVPAMCPVSVPVLCMCPDRCLGLRRPHPPCTNVNTPPATQSVHALRTASPANINGIAGPGAFYFPRAHSVGAGRRRRPGRIIPVIRNAAELHRAQAPFPYYSTLYGIKSASPGRQHERGIPLSNSPLRRGPAPHTPRQRFAAAPRPAPGAGPVDTPRRHPQDQLANIATQTQAWTHATSQCSTLHKATRTRAQPQTRTPGIDNGRGRPESTRTTLTPAGLRGTPAGAPSRLVPHTLGAPAYHSQTTLAPRKPGPALCGSFLARAGPVLPVFKDDQNASNVIFQPPPSAKSHTEPRRATHTPDQVLNTPPHPKSQRLARPAPPGDGQNAALSLQANQSSARPTTDAYAGGAPHGSFLARSAPAFHRAALRFTLALASPSPSLRSTSASAWAALSTQTTKQRLPHQPSPYRSVSAPAGLMPAASLRHSRTAPFLSGCKS